MARRHAALLRCISYLVATSVGAGATLATAQQGTLRGVVIDSLDNTPVGSADVAVIALQIVVRTDEQGRFVIRRLPQGDLDLTVRHLGHRPAKLTIHSTGGGVDSIKILLVSTPEMLP